MTCPDCGAELQHGYWELVRCLDDKSRLVGWRARWTSSEDLVCPGPGFLRFQLSSKYPPKAPDRV